MVSNLPLYSRPPWLLWTIFSGLLALLFSAIPIHAQVRDFTSKPPRNERELIVKFRPDATPNQKSAALRNAAKVRSFSFGAEIKAPGQNVATISKIEVPVGIEVDAELARLQLNPAVEFVEPNYTVKLFVEDEEAPPIERATNAMVLPNDFEFAGMYALYNRGGANAKTNADVSAPEAWAFSTGSKSVVVAVIDTGIDYLHEDLEENLWVNRGEIPGNGLDDDANGFVDDVNGYDFVWNDSDPFDDNQHGTHVAGTIGAKGNNGIGTVGVAWEVSLMALKAFDELGNGTVSDAIDAITYAVGNGARIINASWGLNERSRALEEVAKFAAERGVLIIAAAGNDRSEAPSYPASFETVLSVGATDARDARADFSNYGAHLDVAAPGANILSTLPENGYGQLSGTSMAAPHVSGTAALVLSRFPVYTREELFDILVNSIDVVSFDLPLGNGRLNTARAVQMDQPLPTAKLTVSETVSGRTDAFGMASGTFFSGYSLNIGAGRTPTDWIQIASSATPITNALIANFDSSLVPDGNAVVQLVVSNLNGSAAVSSARIRVFNGLITYPQSGDVIGPGNYTVRGTIHGAGKSYELFYGDGVSPTTWKRIGSGGTGKLDEKIGDWDATNLPSGFYSLKLAVNDRGTVRDFLAPLIYIDRKLKPGWPVYVGSDADFPATEWRNVRPADLNGDGAAELVLVDAGTRNRKQQLHVFELDGAAMWSRELGFDIPPDLPAIGDVNQDGTQEIFVDGTNGIVAFKFNGDPVPGWPVETGSANHAKVLADVDGDSELEVIVYAQEYAATQVLESRELFVFDHDGILVRKWTLPWCGFTNDVQKIHPAVANLDDDPALEIIVPSGCSDLFAFDIESEFPKWTASVTGKLLSSPVIGDVDGNGSVDVVVAVSSVRNGDPAGVYVFDRLGQRWTGWPVMEEYSFNASPALGDLDQDGRLEIVLVDDAISGKLHVVQWDGFEADGWPREVFRLTSSRAGISIADVNNDEFPDIVASVPGYPLLLQQFRNNAYLGGVTAWDLHGNVIPFDGTNAIKTLPFESTSQPRFHRAAPVVFTDLDANGRMDLVLASVQDRTYGTLPKLKDRSSLYTWELPSSGGIEWPMFGHDVANRGAYSLPLTPAPVPTNVTRAIRDRVVTFEDRDLRIYATTNDWNAAGLPLTIVSVGSSSNASVTVENDSVLVYRPKPNFASFDSFTYTVRDANGAISTADVFIKVKPLNDPPTADNISLEVNKNSNGTALYTGHDPENAPLNFRITVPPQHGEVWNYPNLGIYYPKPGFSGTDSFSYVANDGKLDSAPAVVSITIFNSNNAPKAVSMNLLTKTNRALNIIPGGTDSDNDPLTFELVTLPEVGTATHVGARFRYTPPTNYIGEASFTYRAFDGTATSEVATITIGIIETNAAPRAREGSASVQPNSDNELKLSGTDPDGDLITFELVSSPIHGQLSGAPPDLVYTPRQDYLGPDRFEFRVTDGFATSEPALFSIQVERSNRPPQARDQMVSAEQNIPVNFNLDASDADLDPVRVVILKGPRYGMVYGAYTNFTYVPKPGILGTDTFTYKLWDGQRFGNVGNVTISIGLPPPDAPPAFTSIEAFDGAVQFRLRVTAGKAFRVESSANLRDWDVVLPSTIPAGDTFDFGDFNPDGVVRIYRAVRE
ncbi:MAG TPA: Ig-like domain-containing protein [Verrucomicrobiae bacterium]